MKSIPIGIKDYSKMKNEDYYIVDKTLLIKEFLDRKAEVTIITRPRRFGKTLNMSMMAEFFDITKDSSELFKKTKIMNTEYASYINSYPVIYITFANAKKEKIDIISAIKSQLQTQWDKYEYVFENLTGFKKSKYKRLFNVLDDVGDSLSGIADALVFLMDQLYIHYGKKVMVFIDEYDIPFIEAYVGGFYKDINNGLASLLHNSLKTSNSLQYAMLTGIQRVAKENIFSDLNNPLVCTVTDPEYASYFGFSKEETNEVLEYYGYKLTSKVKDMYDGYRFGNHEIYNPWSVFHYVSRGELQAYWVNTSSNTMIKKAMDNADMSFKTAYETLIKEGKTELTADMQSNFYEINTTPSLWGLLINAGYLTVIETVSEADSRYIVKIPNKEVSVDFQKLTAYYLQLSEANLNDLFYALKKKDIDEFINIYKNILLTLPSYHDLKCENSYHMMMLGICAWLRYEYDIVSNREEGTGRCDIILNSKRNELPSYVFEFKYTREDKEDLNILAQTAIEQIENQQYDINLGGDIVYIGLAHCKKNVEIQWKNR